MKHSLTPNEIQFLKAITYSDFYDGRKSVVWDFSVLDDFPIKGKSRSGIIGSLAAKGFINVLEKPKKFIMVDGQKRLNPYYSPDDCGTFEITSTGYEALDERSLITESGYFI